MKILRTLFIIQLLCYFLLTALGVKALLLNQQQQINQTYQLQQNAIAHQLKNFVGNDYKTLVQQIRASSNPQLLMLSQLDGVVLHEHNAATAKTGWLDSLYQFAGIQRQAAVMKNQDLNLQLSFQPDFDQTDAVFRQSLLLILLAPLLLCLLPALCMPVLQKNLLKRLNYSISQSIERFMRDPEADLQLQELPGEFDSVGQAMAKFASFSQQQFQQMSQHARQATEDAFKDTVTGLPNRNKFMQYYQEQLAEGSQVDFGIFAISRCTELQQINQSRGYQEGDKYIQAVAAILAKVAGNYRDFQLFRLNSSDFGLLLPRVTAKEAENFAQQLQSRLNEYQQLTELDSVAYTGLVSYETGKALGELLAVADMSISLAQTKQSNSWHLQKESAGGDLAASSYGNQNWRLVIEDVINNNRLSLLIQSIQPSNRSSKTYSEMLVRFKTMENQLLPTAAFLAMAEKLDKITEIDRLIVETGITAIKHRNLQDQYFGINLSPRSVHDDHFVIWLERRLLKDATLASKLVFEVSEFGMQQNLKTSKRFIDMLHRCGSRLTVEKFGTGITSFKFFRDLKPDFIKMDGSYTRQIDEDKNNQYFMRLMIDLAHRIGVAVLAESVESQEEKHTLESLFIDGTQGYYIGKPAPL
jgi:diguanylate cyclase (GGDEF)-like protein